MITLIVVDCQVDFITGSLAVSGATEAIESIKTYIEANKDNIERVIFTMDWHPYKGFYITKIPIYPIQDKKYHTGMRLINFRYKHDVFNVLLNWKN